MKKKGNLHPVWTSSAEGVGVRDVCFDGRYVWVLTHMKGQRMQLLVLDPETEKVWDAIDALPEGSKDTNVLITHTIKLAPVGPGKICAVGSFGRTWVALATFDPTAGKGTVKVIHEAREAQITNSAEQLEKKTVDFQPASSLCPLL